MGTGTGRRPAGMAAPSISAVQMAVAAVAWVLLISVVHSAQDSQPGAMAAKDVRNPSTVLKSMLQGAESDTEEEEKSRASHFAMFGGKGKLSCLACDDGHCHEGNDSNNDVQAHICRNAVKCFTAIVRNVEGTIQKSKGCARDFQQLALLCSTDSYDGRHVHKEKQVSAQYAFNCCKEDMCNADAQWPALPDVPVIESSPEDEDEAVISEVLASNKATVRLVMAVGGAVLVLILVTMLIILIMHRRHRKRMAELSRANQLGYANDEEELIGLRARPAGDSTLREYNMDSSVTSGSGSGMPFHQRRTIAREIKLGRCIGKGRYGEVCLGLHKGDEVAVKMVPSREENSWRRELEIYETRLLDHPNILRYIAADTTSQNSCTQFWLITQYHPKGSLFDYLARPESFLIDVQSALKLLFTAICGIDHLHLSVTTNQKQPETSATSVTQNKMAIAHRDIKSKNILVSKDGYCVIADFGLALRQSQSTQDLSEKEVRVGTKRYMSPEVLDLSIMKGGTHFDSFLRSDMYSFSLVMWEVLRRTDLGADGPAQGQALPYHQDVGADPDYDEMKEVVCQKQVRPELDERWENSTITRDLTKCMVECWDPTPSARPSATKTKKILDSLLRPARAFSQSEL